MTLRPSPLAVEVLEEFEEAAASCRCARFAREAQWEAAAVERLDERRSRSREEILEDIRRLDGIEQGYIEPEFAWRTCPVCLVEFAVLLPERGRPKEYCGLRHAWVAAKRAVRVRIRKVIDCS